MQTLAGIASILTIIVIQVAIIGAFAYGIYRLVKKLNHDKIDYEYRYKEYYNAKNDIDNLEQDIRNHQEDKP